MSYTVLDAVPNTDAWLKARKSFIGASEVACILGLSKWSTPLGIYQDKLNPNVSDEMTEWQEWGHRLEDAIATWVGDTQGHVVQDSPGLLQSTEYPWLGATPDRINANGEPIELKTSSTYMKEAWADGVPLNYQVQVLVQMIVLGAKRGYLAVLHGGNQPEFYVIEWNQAAVDQIISITKDFWFNNVQALTPPEPVTISEVAEVFKDSGKALSVDERILNAWWLDGQARSALKKAKEDSDLVAAALKELLNTTDTSELQFEGKPLYTWKRPKPSVSFDMALFKSEHPDTYAQYMREHPSTPRFLRKTLKEFEADPPESWEAGMTIHDLLEGYDELHIWKSTLKEETND